MTVAAGTPINSYVGNNSASAFSFTFPVFLSSQIVVTAVLASTGATATLILGTDYSVTGLNPSGDPASSGSISLINAGQAWLSSGNLATGYTLVIQSSFAYSQTTSIRNQGDFYRSALEDALDTLEYQIQQLILTIGSQVILPTGLLPSAFSPVLPVGMPSSAGLAIVVNSTGTGFSLGAGGSVTLPVNIAQGGTNSTTPLANGRVMSSSGGKILESAILKETAAGLSFVNTATQGIVGAVTNDAAAAGNVGEYKETVGTTVNFGASGVFSDYASLSLTAGDWDVTFLAQADPASVGAFTVWEIGISITSGNSTTGLVVGSNRITILGSLTADGSGSIPSYRLSLASTTTVYAKIVATFSGGSGVPRVIGGRISARRVR